MTILQRLDPPIALITPLGQAWGYFIYEEGMGSDTFFGCFQIETSEFWWWDNRHIRLFPSITLETGISEIPTIDGLENHLKRYPEHTAFMKKAK